MTPLSPPMSPFAYWYTLAAALAWFVAAQSTPASPDIALHLLSAGEFLVKLAGGVAALWVSLEKIVKPYQKFRKGMKRDEATDALKPELEKLEELKQHHEKLYAQGRDILHGQEKILVRQTQIFRELDLIHLLAAENSDRHDETNDLLDAVGFASERRTSEQSEQRKRVSAILAALKTHKTARDRAEDPAPELERPIHDDG
jgi:hypothetical protein